MNPALDQFLVAALVLGAAGYFVVRHLRQRKSSRACGGDCCGTRKGEGVIKGREV
jgi:FeoB-associated Cys-rich membrane protein